MIEYADGIMLASHIQVSGATMATVARTEDDPNPSSGTSRAHRSPSASSQISFSNAFGAGQTGAVTRSSEGETLLRCARRIRRPA